ncbi:MAG TPA: hypothetical protein VIM96_07795 [Pseudomonadales bacterium]
MTQGDAPLRPHQPDDARGRHDEQGPMIGKADAGQQCDGIQQPDLYGRRGVFQLQA